MIAERAEGPLSVLIVDGARLARENLRLQLEGPDVVQVAGIAQDGFEALVLSRVVNPDVVLAHVSLTNPDAAALTAQLSALIPPVPLALMIPDDDQQLAAEALGWGAAACVGERSGLSELLTAVRAVAFGERYLSATLRPSSAPAAGG